MENLFNYITYLHKYLNLLIETEEAYEIKNQEVKTEVKQHNRWRRLVEECVDIYKDLFLNFNKQLVDLGNILSIELSNSNAIQQNQLHDQLNDLLKEIAEKFKKAENGIGFSKESIGKKFKKILVKTNDGGTEEKMGEYDFSMDMLAYDVGEKLNQIHKLIYERFKFLNPKKDSESLHIEEPNNKNKQAVASYALVHVFWGRQEEDKKITKTNNKVWADKYGISKNTLLKYYSDQIEKKGRLPDECKDENKKHLKPFFKRFEDAITMLKTLNEKAYNDANNELNLLKVQYNIFLA